MGNGVQKPLSCYRALDHPIVQCLFYLVVFWIPLYRWRHLSETYRFLKVDWLLVMALGLILIPYFVAEKRLPARLKTNLAPLMLIFFVLNVVSSLLSPYPAAALNGLRILLYAFVFIVLAQMLINRAGFVHILPAVLCAAVTVNATLSVAGFYLQSEMFTLGVAIDQEKVVLRGRGATLGANNAALMSVFILPLLVHWIFYARTRKRRIAAAVAIVVNLAGIVSTLARGGFLLLIFVSSLILWEQRHRFQIRYLGLLVAGIGAFLLLGVAAIPESFFERQATLAEGVDADYATRRRSAYLKVGWQSFLKRPVLGAGTDTFKNIWQDSTTARYFKQELRYAHNTYVEVAVGSGILGLIFFLWILGRALRSYNRALVAFRRKNQKKMASIVSAYRLSFVGVLVYLLLLSAIEHKLLLLAIALSQVALREAPTEELPR